MQKQKHFCLRMRARIIQAIRAFFIKNGYLEVETPLRIPAPIPEAHIDGFESEEWYLQSSPEICMKRMAAMGYEKIFQICKCFRKEERGDRHLTEMTLLEWYTKGFTYKELMAQTAELIRYVGLETGGTKQLIYGDKTIFLDRPWEYITVARAFETHADISMERAMAKGIFDEVMAFDIEPELGKNRPAFLFDYPAAMGALARLKPNDSGIAERFELYIAGMELANGFSELTDPQEQQLRFSNELALKKNAGKKLTPMPCNFLKDLEHLPDTAGIALGVDRLVMLFANVDTIDQVVAFTPETL
ncbi:lysyl-tRNA synthetase, class 2 [Desulfocicer vacuolatum DSM 3385]|uniref:Lysyl-tRNA synthetase, class 2 n=1 Tax=Desulfocicer vacuolatum DSM 3385 TaxID=1121400 RepID=A0A1W2C202_9BACT|nr:EF-P lysine aminoacylase EpmA [Desulfocicer vacuolatum]SMC79180.1 lysyl-tRNA synthetase, class 2 [Desulfocicer vacuolatum DSM 3385]